ncbi:MAG: 1-deoxy-D-xylulose-5-phosphate reductoisomerase [Coriobacteriia bacterium]|nr:1-deoxy-D-xylulose-5-phosphate reductoisomerase [Coriobacteriia bacterium]
MTQRLKVAILGSTGSIGRQALDVASVHADRIEVVALSAHGSDALVLEQARAHGVENVALASEPAALRARAAVVAGDPFTEILAGPEAVVELAAHSGADVVLNALVGAAGLRASVATLTAGKTLALANKESLVVGGELVMALAAPGQLLPVDSEHSAIFQCYVGEYADDATRIWLTASGGPFRGRDREFLSTVTAADALAHPTWTMGPKITIDSSTLMNKGLEVIEAHHLFGVRFDQIRVVVHPQSCVHSMVEFADGSVKAHLGATDMRIPIQYAFSHPRRWDAPLEPVDFTKIGHLDFADPDSDTFGCLRLALAAGQEGGTLPAAMNAANEIAVAAFLAGECGFLDIEGTVERVMDAHTGEKLTSIEQVEAVDAWARAAAKDVLAVK